MSTRAKIRHMHIVDGVPKKEVARRLGVDVKTVRRHLASVEPHRSRSSPRRGNELDEHRDEIVELLRSDPRISAKRVGRILEENHGARTHERSLRRYVRGLRGTLKKAEAFVHRTHLFGETIEIDFGESWAVIGGKRVKVFFFVATLPASNSYFAKAYRLQRTECLLDGMTSAVEWFGGLPVRFVFDNASTAVRRILKGDEREEARLFHAYRAEWPVDVDFCSPASGWEKGSVERGVGYVRGLCLRPTPVVETIDELNAHILRELSVDLERRCHRDGRTAAQALAAERERLRPLPTFRPETGRVISVTADKHGHVRIDRSIYSVHTDFARRTLTARLYHDRVQVAFEGAVIATHARSFQAGTFELDLEHVLQLLEKKPRAAREATVIRQLGLPRCFEDLRVELRRRGRRSDREWVQIIGLIVDHSLEALTSAVEMSLASGVPGKSSVQQTLRRMTQPHLVAEPVALIRPGLKLIEVAPARLGAYGSLLGTECGRMEA